MAPPALEDIKICHIVHVDKLPLITGDAYLWSDAEVHRRNSAGTTIGMGSIKKRRMEELTLSCYPDLYVGGCVPFYFCPRSIMLYMFHMNNHQDIEYDGGQEPIVHLVSDLSKTVQWADAKAKRWVFTTSNAGSRYFNDYNSLENIDRINWDAVRAHYWSDCREEKQAEFLIEDQFPWELVERIGVYSEEYSTKVKNVLDGVAHHPVIEVKPDWYY
jgi:hypothetical protein